VVNDFWIQYKDVEEQLPRIHILAAAGSTFPARCMNFFVSRGQFFETAE